MINNIIFIELDISISTQSNLFLAKYNNLLCFFFLSFVSSFNFITIAKSKEVIKENAEVIKPTNFLCFNMSKNGS